MMILSLLIWLPTIDGIHNVVRVGFGFLRALMATGQQPELVCGQLFKRCRLTPAHDPAVVPALELPPAF